MNRSVFARRFSDLEMVVVKLSSYFPIHRARRAVLRLFGGSLASGVTIYHGTEVRSARKLLIGENSSIGNNCVLDARGGLTIGANVNISTGVQIWSAQHDWRSADFAYVTAPVVVGDNAWVSARAILLPGAQIGHGAVVAAGAVVSGAVPPGALVGGVPARVIGQRPNDVSYTLPPSRDKAWWW